jgi:hypothetical protein
MYAGLRRRIQLCLREPTNPTFVANSGRLELLLWALVPRRTPPSVELPLVGQPRFVALKEPPPCLINNCTKYSEAQWPVIDLPT